MHLSQYYDQISTMYEVFPSNHFQNKFDLMLTTMDLRRTYDSLETKTSVGTWITEKEVEFIFCCSMRWKIYSRYCFDFREISKFRDKKKENAGNLWKPKTKIWTKSNENVFFRELESEIISMFSFCLFFIQYNRYSNVQLFQLLQPEFLSFLSHFSDNRKLVIQKKRKNRKESIRFLSMSHMYMVLSCWLFFNNSLYNCCICKGSCSEFMFIWIFKILRFCLHSCY